MRPILILLLTSILITTASAYTTQACPALPDMPMGTLARGDISPVPTGDLYVGVLDGTLAVGGVTDVGGPPAFLLNGDEALGLEGVAGIGEVKPGAAAFLQRGKQYRLTNRGEKPARFRFVGLGTKGEVKGAHYDMEPMPWGPGAGKSYYVTLDRSYFSPNSATPWHYHTGPAFGILDDGTWENRQTTGDTRLIPTPGYYIQPASAVHQLAQVGKGGYALIFQFAPNGQGLTGGGAGRGEKTPTIFTKATSIARANTTPIDGMSIAPPTPAATVTLPQPVAAPTVPSTSPSNRADTL